MLWLWIVFLVILFIYCYQDTRLPKDFPPGPRVLPIIGNVHHFMYHWAHFRSWRLVISHLSEEYGPLITFKLGGVLQVFACGKEAVKEVFTNKATEGRPPMPIFQLGYKDEGAIIFTNGELWNKNRTLSMKVLKEFGFGKMSMEPLIQEEVLCFVSSLKNKSLSSGPSGVLMQRAFHAPIINGLWLMMVGARFKYDDNFLMTCIKLLEKHQEALTSSGLLLNAFPALGHIAPDYTGYRALMVGSRFLWDYLEKMVDEHKKAYDKDKVRDFVDGLFREMEDNKNIELKEDNIIDICMDLFFGGLDTASNILSFAFLYMILHPEVQDKVQQELDDVIGRDSLPSFQDAKRLPYTSATILEIQRFASVLHTMPRLALEDFEIMGYKIPKGVIVWGSIYSVNMDKEHWKDPENFRPERFLQNGELIKDDWLLFFGAGRRRCLGEFLGKMSVFLYFSTLLLKFTFRNATPESPPSIEALDGVAVKPRPYRVIIKERI